MDRELTIRTDERGGCVPWALDEYREHPFVTLAGEGRRGWMGEDTEAMVLEARAARMSAKVISFEGWRELREGDVA